MVRLEDKLKEWGNRMTADEFRDKLSDLFCRQFPSYSVEDMICKSSARSAFIVNVRLALRLVDIPDSAEVEEVVLRTVLNIRREGGLSLRERGVA
jgi:hypothetical protein